MIHTPPCQPLRCAIAVSLALASLGAAAQSAEVARAVAEVAVSRNWNLPAAPLADTLARIAREGGQRLSADPALIAGKTAAPVNGSLSPAAAARQALAGTGLELVVTEGGTLTVRPAPPDFSAEKTTAGKEAVMQSLVVTSKRTRDEIGKDNVYEKNVTNVYADRKQLQQIKATNPGDVFKGMNGVYSMDTRASQSITPNIRGITGEGRTPLTIDGTEQSTNVWLHMFGAGNRSYADPALFRSVEVEKGPSLSRGIKSGVGGAVNIRTIEADDIIPEGRNWGIELKLESAGNTSESRYDPNSFYGKDYRNIPGAYRNNVRDVVIPGDPPRSKGKSEVFNLEDKTGMVALAMRNEITDFLASYSKRKQGNYYAGKKNAGRYSGHDPFDSTSTDGFIPNMTKLYYAGDEVFNTDSETETTLLKNNWYLPNQQKIGLQFMRTDMTFGETTPGDTVLLWAMREGFEHGSPEIDWSTYPRLVREKPRSELRLDSYKLSYDIKPEGSDWLNLETSLWRTEATGTRYQTGKHPYSIDVEPGSATEAALQYYDRLVSMVPEYANILPLPAHDGTIRSTGRQWTSHDRTGFDFSNLMRLSDKLKLTIGGGYQKEKLEDRVERSVVPPNGLFAGLDGVHKTTDLLGPRSGERKEWSTMMNLAWQPTGWLTLTAGTRYMRYEGKDTGLAKLRRQKNAFNAATQRVAGLELQYQKLMTPAEQAELNRLRAEATAAYYANDFNDPSNFKTIDLYNFTTGNGWERYTYQDRAIGNAQVRETGQRLLDFLSKHNADPFSRLANLHFSGLEAQDAALNLLFGSGGYSGSPSSCTGGRPDCTKYQEGNYWTSAVLVPSKDGKFDSSQNPFANGELDATEMVDDPYNPGTLVRKYQHNPYGEVAYERLDTGKTWEMPEDQSGEAFSPVLSATARVTPFGTAFVRYAQTTRFPSLHELTSTSSWAGTEGNFAINGASKPERNTNWEIGYAHDLRQFFPKMQLADVRFSYFNTEIKDFIDRSWDLETIQFDKKKTSGLELQSRFDSGRFFGSLGATYRLKQETCDKDYASGMDPFYNRIPTCMTGGFPGSYSGNSLQPKYSIDLLLGTRLLSNKLELGWRSVYHAGTENKDLDKLLASQAGAGFTTWLPRDMWRSQGMSSFHWESVLLHDIYARFDLSKDVTLNLNVSNLTDEYYLDPMSKMLLPAPGRTISAGVTVKF